MLIWKPVLSTWQCTHPMCSLLSSFLLLLFFSPAGGRTSTTVGVSAQGSVAVVSTVRVTDHNTDCYKLYVALAALPVGVADRSQTL